MVRGAHSEKVDGWVDEIADKLFISTTTVKGHLQSIYQKLEVGKRREAVKMAKKIGIL
jgi:LuxR family maltose regulon positive regulatory protein